MDAKIVLIAIVAVLAGAATGGIVTANFVPRAGEPDTAMTNGVDAEARDAAQKEAAEARAEAARWQAEADRLARQLSLKEKEPQAESEAVVEPIGDLAESAPSTMDASMREELETYRARDREREERSAEQRGQREDWQAQRVNRRTDMFTELIERTKDPVEQQRWADIEQQMTQTRDLFQEMRRAETDEERYAVRGALDENFDAMQSLLKEQQNAVLNRALKEQGITDTKQLSQIQDAVRSSLSDESFQMSPGRGPGRGGFSGGRPTRGGPGRGGPGGRGSGGGAGQGRR